MRLSKIDAKYVVFSADLSMGYSPAYFKNLEKMGSYINDEIRAGKIVTVKTVNNK